MADQLYLPAGSRVLVTRKNGVTEWYTTRAEVICVNPVDVECPKTRTTVSRVEYMGLLVHYRPHQVMSRRLGMVEIDEKKATGVQYSQLFYDLPTGSGVVHPSVRLRSIAVRLNLSVWAIPTADIPWAYMDELSEAGARWNCVKFDISESRHIVQQALNSLKTEVQKAVARNDQAQRDAESILTAEGSRSTKQREEAYLLRCKQIQKRMTDLEKDFREVSERFGINSDALKLDVARNASDAIAAGMHQRARAYRIAANQAAGSNSETLRILGQQAQRDAVPAGILSDALQDEGNEVGVTLNEAFNESAVATADDGTFSLGDD